MGTHRWADSRVALSLIVLILAAAFAVTLFGTRERTQVAWNLSGSYPSRSHVCDYPCAPPQFPDGPGGLTTSGLRSSGFTVLSFADPAAGAQIRIAGQSLKLPNDARLAGLVINEPCGARSDCRPNATWYLIVRAESRILISARSGTVLSAHYAPGDDRAFDFLQNVACNPIDPPLAEPPPTMPFIRAVPNPVPAGSGLGATTLTWDIGERSRCVHGEVHVSVDGGAFALFGFNNAGVQSAPWIEAGHEYRFILGRKHVISKNPEIVAEVQVRRAGSASTQPVSPPRDVQTGR